MSGVAVSFFARRFAHEEVEGGNGFTSVLFVLLVWKMMVARVA